MTTYDSIIVNKQATFTTNMTPILIKQTILKHDQLHS